MKSPTPSQHYGRGPIPGPVSIADLLARSYGRAANRLDWRYPDALPVSCSMDDGEILRPTTADDYVVGPLVGGPDPVPTTPEYVVGPLEPGDGASAVSARPEPADASTPQVKGPAPLPAPAGGVPSTAVTPNAPPSAGSTPLAGAAPAPGAATAVPPAPPITDGTRGGDAPGPATAPSSPPATDAAASKASSISDDELVADMEAILTGQKVYDPVSKRTVDPSVAQRPDHPQDRDPDVPMPPSDGHAIFDRIAQSMAYANAYDLGTIELENRFTNFDRVDETVQGVKEAKQHAGWGDSNPLPMPVRPQDFLADLDAIRRGTGATSHDAVSTSPAQVVTGPEHTGQASVWSTADRRRQVYGTGGCGVGPVTGAMSAGRALSRPFFDAGEHVLAGDPTLGTFRVGAGGGVELSYGDIIGLGGDLYATVDDLLNAPPAELSTLKRLLDRSTSYYTGGRTNRSLDVTNADWDNATNGRYLRLAEDNADHFAPNDLFNDAVVDAVDTRRNHRTAWEMGHRRAIETAQRVNLASPGVSVRQDEALVINAFADHYLTDAFASGHAINKDVVMALFRANFYTGRDLNSDAVDFFKRLAIRAWNTYPDVAANMSKLETVDLAHWHGIPLPFHPDIDTADRFRLLLTKAAEEEPDRVASFVVKAVHDKLNREGLRATNGAGDPEWTLFGDGHQDGTSLAIMRRAVSQSAANLEDPAINVSNLDMTAIFAKVWRHVPQLTPASRQIVVALVRDFTNPRSTALVDAAALVIHEQIDTLVKTLTDPANPRLQPA